MHVVLTSINNLFLINERPIAIALAMRTNKFSHCTEKECATGMTLTHKVFTLLHTYSHQIKHKNTSHNQSKHYLRMPFTTLLTQLIQTYSPSPSSAIANLVAHRHVTFRILKPFERTSS